MNATSGSWKQVLSRHRATTVALSVVLLLSSPAAVSAQDQDQGSFLAEVFKRAVVDPTTYAPAVLGYHATTLDWRTSQPFFRSGFYERNPRFTVSGLPNDVALSYHAGNRKIRADTLVNMEVSFVSNLVSNVVERALIDRYPTHRKLLRTLGWIERIGLASYTSYALSAQHYRQARDNSNLARQLGLR